jgi:hypothetical protein
MTATLVFHTGDGYPIDPEGVENLLRKHHVTKRRTNGSQERFYFDDAEYPFSIIANVRSEAYDLLQASVRNRPLRKATA